MNLHHIDVAGVESFTRLCDRERRQFPRSPLAKPARTGFASFSLLPSDVTVVDPCLFDQPLEQGEPS